MVYRLSDNVVSPLGLTTAENYAAVKAGRSALLRYDGLWGLAEPFTASLFTSEQTALLAVDGLTRFEALAYQSVRRAVCDAGIDAAAADVVLILSTTKGNIELLGQQPVSLSDSAGRIARKVGVSTKPIVVCNACISGVAAQVLAQRLLESGAYRYAIVCGADVQNVFTVAGFQSLKAVATEACRPFDIERLGLNLGEAAATLVLTSRPDDGWALQASAIRNDAYHISSPSKNGEGARQVLAALQAVPDELAFINAHGTATMFNDQMESVAIERAGFGSVPVNGLKGYYGHTLGAAGLLETVLSMATADDHTIIGTRGYEERGVSGKINIVARHTATDKQAFAKMISGFGGGNAAVLYTRRPHDGRREHALRPVASPHLTLTAGGPALTELYRQHVGDYPKYYKMDGLSRLGFVASEMLLHEVLREPCPTDCAVILFNHSSSIAADRKFLASIADRDDFYPSPSVFVYTLPNIVTGEIAIRNHFHGETSFYVLPDKDEQLMQRVIRATLASGSVQCVLTGWLDYEDDEHYEADLYIITNRP